MAYIDGTRDVRAHGDPDMPVWRHIFREQSSWAIGERAEVRGKLLLIGVRGSADAGQRSPGRLVEPSREELLLHLRDRYVL